MNKHFLMYRHVVAIAALCLVIIACSNTQESPGTADSPSTAASAGGSAGAPQTALPAPGSPAAPIELPPEHSDTDAVLTQSETATEELTQDEQGMDDVDFDIEDITW